MFESFLPERTIVTFGSVAIYWYGLFAALATVAAYGLGRTLARRAGWSENVFSDAFFVALIVGLFGARLWHVIGDAGYYRDHLLEVFAVWQGGLAIHGGLVAGVLALGLFARAKHHSFFFLADLFAPLLALAHAIGRWGNYFNQELFGRPTDLPWAIPIALDRRPLEYVDATHFHPTFLYESLGLLAITALLVWWFWRRERVGRERALLDHGMLFAAYLALTGLLRSGLEFLRIDAVPTVAGVRVTLLIALTLTLAGLILFFTLHRKRSNHAHTALQF